MGTFDLAQTSTEVSGQGGELWMTRPGVQHIGQWCGRYHGLTCIEDVSSRVMTLEEVGIDSADELPCQRCR